MDNAIISPEINYNHRKIWVGREWHSRQLSNLCPLKGLAVHIAIVWRGWVGMAHGQCAHDDSANVAAPASPKGGHGGTV